MAPIRRNKQIFNKLNTGLSCGINLLQMQDETVYNRYVMSLTLTWISLGGSFKAPGCLLFFDHWIFE
jgi:hypothetical protein